MDRKSNLGLIERYASFVGPQQCSASLPCLVSGIFGYATMLVQIKSFDKGTRSYWSGLVIYSDLSIVFHLHRSPKTQSLECTEVFGGGRGLGLAE
jgi:hypothetical protein